MGCGPSRPGRWSCLSNLLLARGVVWKNQNTIFRECFAARRRAARILTAEKVEGSDKLLKFTVGLGSNDPERTVVSGIAKFYTPEEMVGKQVVLVSNLMPAKLRGIRSEGMILCASDAADQALKLVTVEPGMEDGAYIR